MSAIVSGKVLYPQFVGLLRFLKLSRYGVIVMSGNVEAFTRTDPVGWEFMGFLNVFNCETGFAQIGVRGSQSHIRSSKAWIKFDSSLEERNGFSLTLRVHGAETHGTHLQGFERGRRDLL